MTGKPSTRQTTLPKVNSSWSIASLLAVFAGIAGLLSAFLQAQQSLNMTFWLRLLMGVCMLLSGILQFVARARMNQKLKALSEQHQK